MKTLNNIIKVSCSTKEGKGVGSALIYLSQNSNQVYIVTAKHCIYGSSEYGYLNPQNQDIKLDFGNHIYTLEETDFILSEEEDERDIAVIIIDKNKVESHFQNIFNIKLAVLSDENIDVKCTLSGFPQSSVKGFKRTLDECYFKIDKDFKGQLQIECLSPVTSHPEAKGLAKGYSGGSVFIENNQECFVFGVIAQFDEYNKRFFCIDFSILNELLVTNNLPIVSLVEIETRKSILEDLGKLRIETNDVLNRINSNNQIGTVHLGRKTPVSDLRKKIKNNNLVIVTGKAGMGKSVLAHNTIKELSEVSIIALKGEDLDKHGISEVFKSKGINSDINDLLNSKGLKSQKIILIDSAEKLLETNNAETILDFFNLLKTRTDVKIIVTCRVYALERLQIRFLQNFKYSNNIYEVPFLIDNELDLITNDYPYIKQLLSKQSLKKVLEIPFNLNMATKVNPNTFNEINSEYDFKNLMWRYVIENEYINRNIQRGEIFTQIALKRANKLTSYVRIKDVNGEIISELLKDGIIIKENSTFINRYTSAHDIYEDWALTRFIEVKFEEWQEADELITSFFQLIGNSPAIHRAFRFWISDKIQLIDYDIEQFIINSLSDDNVETYWKDETLIAILQSSYSKSFLNNNKDFLFKNDFRFLKRCLLLLQVACQRPDISMITQLNDNKETNIYENHYLKPFGEGWVNIIYFINTHLSSVKSLFPTIIPLLFQWRKLYDYHKPLRKEARQVGEIILYYLDLVKGNYSGLINVNGKQNKLTDSSLALLFRLTEVVQEEVKEIIENALKDTENKNNYDNGFHNKVLNMCLSWKDSYELCQFLPKLVIEIARKKWFYIKPTQEEIAEKRKINPLAFIDYSDYNENLEQRFGIANYENNYSPAGSYQTFIINMLNSNFVNALEFIVELFEHSLKSISKNNREDFFDVFIKLNNGQIIKQYGNSMLWSIYRGTSLTSNLLQSILMGLEDWFLQLVKVIDSKNNKYPFLEKKLNTAFDYLIIKSPSVAITSVLVSIITAYPNVFGKRILPLFRVKEFFDWDFDRYSREISAFEPMDFQNPFAQELRHKSNNLPHRKIYLETLIRQLRFGELENEIWTILDEFYNQKPLNELWHLALSRMDSRKLKFSEIKGQYAIFEPEMDDELKPIIDAGQRERERDSPILEASMWARYKFEEKEITNDNYEKWNEYYNVLSNVKLELSTIAISQPATLAYVGIKYFFRDLNDIQEEWCYRQITNIVNLKIQKSRKPHEVEGYTSLSHNIMDDAPAMKGLVFIIHFYENEDYIIQTKRILLQSILLYEGGNLKNDRLLKLKVDLWKYCPDFALSCIKGIVEFSKITDLIRRVENPWRNEDENNIEQLAKECNSKINTIFQNVLTDEIEFDIDEINLETHSSWKLREAFLLIPYDTQNEDLQKLMFVILNLYQKELMSGNYSYESKNLPSEVKSDFEIFSAYFLLSQPKDIALKFFNELLDKVYSLDIKTVKREGEKLIEFAESCLEWMIIRVDNNDLYIENFTFLWESLHEKIQKSPIKYFSYKLLLSIEWKATANNWKPIIGKKKFYEKAILHIEALPATIHLISGIGFKELMPDGIRWIVHIMKKNNKPLNRETDIFYAERLIQRVISNTEIRKAVKSSKTLREDFIYLLDELINNNSSAAFLIREDFISAK